MLKTLITFLAVIFSCLCLPVHASKPVALKINIISRNLYNQAGKEVDVLILKEELEGLGHHVHLFDYLKDSHLKAADINIFLAQFKSDLFSKAKLNWLVANPDFCVATWDELQKLDLILCKTEECCRIFAPLSKATYYLGFTSLDCHLPSVSKNFSKHFHLAGKSVMKATKEVLKVWKNHPEFPKLVLIKRRAGFTQVPKNISLITNRIPRSNLMEMQNACGIHLCPSKTEGFGHYIMEAMSCGAVVVTTDAPPMNEFITDKRCLVAYNHTLAQNYATLYVINEKELVRIVKSLQRLSEEELKSIGQHNREEYLRRRAEFKQNLKKLMDQTVQELEPS